MNKQEKKIIDAIQSIPTKCPKRESDEYDRGRLDFKEELLLALLNQE